MFERTVLDRGLVVVTEKRPSELASVICGIRTGSKWENERNSGITHFFEHMLFGGTKNYPKREQVRDVIRERGGYLNAHTGPQRMIVDGETGSEDFRTLFDVVTDMVKNPLVRTKDVENERKIVLDEKRRSIDNYDREFYYNVSRSMFKGGPGLETLGTEESIKKISSKEMTNWGKQFMVQNNMILSYAGNASHKKVVEMTENALKDVDEKRVPEPEFKLKKPGENFFEKEKVKGAKTAVSIATMNFEREDYFLFFTTLGYLQNRMFDEARVKRGLTYGFSYDENTSNQETTARISATHSPDKCEEIRTIMEKEIKKAIDGKISKKELLKKKKTMLYNEKRSEERTLHQTERGFNWERIHRINELNNYTKLVKAITPKQMAYVSNKYFSEDKQYWTVMKPK